MKRLPVSFTRQILPPIPIYPSDLDRTVILSKPQIISLKIQGHSMETVRIRKTVLIQKLKENKEKHDKLLQQSKENFFKLSKKLLAEASKRLERGDPNWKKVLDKLVPVIDRTTSYTDVLGMLKLSTDTIIELTHEEYQAYVQNNWSWRSGFLSNVCYYSSGPTGPTGPTGTTGEEGESEVYSLSVDSVDF